MADETDNLTIQILREIQATLLNHDLRFEQIDRRFEQIDQRFEHIDQRFEQIDQRFSQIDERLDRFDRRFERIEKQMDHRFDIVDRRLEALNDLLIKASGEATQASVRHDMVQRQLAGVEMEIGDLRSRIERLEEKV
jgi:predicted  nucleic acid-binding Zn-ribbon protein